MKCEYCITQHIFFLSIYFIVFVRIISSVANRDALICVCANDTCIWNATANRKRKTNIKIRISNQHNGTQFISFRGILLRKFTEIRFFIHHRRYVHRMHATLIYLFIHLLICILWQIAIFNSEKIDFVGYLEDRSLLPVYNQHFCGLFVAIFFTATFLWHRGKRGTHCVAQVDANYSRLTRTDWITNWLQ